MPLQENLIVCLAARSGFEKNGAGRGGSQTLPYGCGRAVNALGQRWRHRFDNKGRLIFVLLALLTAVLAACTGTDAGTQAAVVGGVPTVEHKLLATVVVSPTPNDAERQATQRALPPAATATRPPAEPTPTVYVGFFITAEAPVEAPPLLPPVQAPPQIAVLPSPTALVAGCRFAPDAVFGTAWSADVRVEQVLGCAAEAALRFDGNVQIFERGVMYWRADTGEIWALAPGGVSAGRYWYVAQAGQVDNNDIAPPSGLRVPIRGFGDVWRNIPGVRDALGFALTDEQQTVLHTQRYLGGTLLLDTSAGQVFALYSSGEVFGPY